MLLVSCIFVADGVKTHTKRNPESSFPLSVRSQEEVYHQNYAYQGRYDSLADKQDGIAQKAHDEGASQPHGYVAIAFVAADSGVQRHHG